MESARFTLERIHPGVTVSIRRNRDTENESILPKYGVPAMLRTFGLTGEVLDVDIANELVQVETYVETEGLLLRFWYPLKDLEKPTSVAKPQLNSTTVNMLKLHRYSILRVLIKEIDIGFLIIIFKHSLVI